MKQGTDSGQRAAYRIFSTVRTICIYLLALLVIAAALLFAADRTPDKTLFGYRYFTVLTNSMVPVFSSGDAVLVHAEDAQSIQVGDIITYHPSADTDSYLTHRVTQKLENYEGTGVTCFRTQGDANDAEDPFTIGEEQVVGTVALHIPKLGLVIRFVQLRWYYVVPLLLLVFLFFHLLGRYFTPEEGTGESGDTPPEERTI